MAKYNINYAISIRGTSFEPDAPYPVAPITIDFRASIEMAECEFDFPEIPDWVYVLSWGKSSERSMTRAEWKEGYRAWRKYIHQA